MKKRGTAETVEEILPSTASDPRATTESIRVPTAPMPVRGAQRAQSAQTRTMSRARKSDSRAKGRKDTSVHNPDALPPSVAALLAVTTIPRPKANQIRRRPSSQRRISIDELVQEWKNDETLAPSYSSSPALSVLLEDAIDDDELASVEGSATEREDSLHTRSTSTESVPSLSADDRSLLSRSSPSTPDSLRSRRSYTTLKKFKTRSLPYSEECDIHHPLMSLPPADEDPDDSLILATSAISTSRTRKSKTSFTSNLTTSIQALKKRALSSLSSLALNSAPQRSSTSPMSDEMLWSRPFLFPRFMPEARPAIDGTPSEAQRQYLNPSPLTFEEQEAPFQLALHAPYLAEFVEGAPTICMQTYSRNGRRKISSPSSSKRGAPDPQSEACRALIMGDTAVRPRELRENSDFLRVIVLEMNMRREGKLETGRAKMWLPPRQAKSSCDGRVGEVPVRWRGTSAY